MISLKLPALMASAGILAGCAAAADPTVAAAQPEGRQCFHADTVNSFSAIGENAVMVRSGVNDYYRLELFGPCLDVDWAMRIGIRSRGSSWVCEGFDAELIVPHVTGVQQCPVRSVRKLSDAEAEALRNR